MVPHSQSCVSIAGEIIRTDGMAQIRPALGAPIVDETSPARVGLEALRLAHGGVCGMPERFRIARTGDIAAVLPSLVKLKDALGCPYIEIDECERPERWQALRCSRLDRRCAQKTNRVLSYSRGIKPGRHLFDDIDSFGVPAHRRVNRSEVVASFLGNILQHRDRSVRPAVQPKDKRSARHKILNRWLQFEEF